jgi:AcrR family transcriptional regulator
MGTSSTAGKNSIARTRERRRYESSIRRAQTAKTRERILVAGSKLAHRASSWDWRDLTAESVAKLAGVSERTVYRYFATEPQLHEAVMRRLEQEAGLSYEKIGLGDLAEVTSRMFASLPSFAVPPTLVIRDATFAASDQRRHESLLRALDTYTADWSEPERKMAAGMLDILWTPLSYERLVRGWGLDPKHAANAVVWAIELLSRAVRENKRPVTTRREEKRRPQGKRNRKRAVSR